jgi:hypothetical protein
MGRKNGNANGTGKKPQETKKQPKTPRPGK